MDKIKLYSKPSCIKCRIVKGLLEDGNVPFEEIDVTSNADLKEELQAYGHHSLPVVAINSLSDSFNGVDMSRLEDVIEKNKSRG